jgi:hypothetical protein
MRNLIVHENCHKIFLHINSIIFIKTGLKTMILKKRVLSGPQAIYVKTPTLNKNRECLCIVLHNGTLFLIN